MTHKKVFIRGALELDEKIKTLNLDIFYFSFLIMSHMFFFFDCELIFMINLVIGKGSAEAEEKLLRSQAFLESKCIQQPQEMMATNSNFT